jgi:hypothetical protein
MSGLQEQKENKHLGDDPSGVKGGQSKEYIAASLMLFF